MYNSVTHLNAKGIQNWGEKSVWEELIKVVCRLGGRERECILCEYGELYAILEREKAGKEGSGRGRGVRARGREEWALTPRRLSAEVEASPPGWSLNSSTCCM